MGVKRMSVFALTNCWTVEPSSPCEFNIVPVHLSVTMVITFLKHMGIIAVKLAVIVTK